MLQLMTELCKRYIILESLHCSVSYNDVYYRYGYDNHATELNRVDCRGDEKIIQRCPSQSDITLECYRPALDVTVSCCKEL